MGWCDLGVGVGIGLLLGLWLMLEHTWQLYVQEVTFLTCSHVQI